MKNASYMEGNLWLYRLYFRVVILLWLPVSLSAVDLPNLTFRTITISDGLSNNIINTIYKDKRGFIWLGTQTGLDRFDGINMKSFLQFSGRTIFPQPKQILFICGWVQIKDYGNSIGKQTKWNRSL